MTLDELLSNILQPAPQNRLAHPWRGANADPSMAMMPQQPQAAPPAAFSAGPPQTAATMPQAAPAPPQASGGGFLSRLFGGQQGAGNETVQWLVQQGYDPGTAQALSGNKEALQKILLAQVASPTERARLGLDQDRFGFDQQKFLIEQGRADRGDSREDKRLGFDESRLKLEQGRFDREGSQWQRLDDDTLYNPTSGDVREVGASNNGFRFDGTSVEAQALNGLMESGALTADQAQQLAAGKTITNPADGSIVFLTPRGIFSQGAEGGPAQPVQPQGGPAAPAPVHPPAPGANAPIGTTRPGVIPLTEGKPGKLATEAETRNRALYTVAAPDLKIALDNFAALENVYSQAASKVLPWGLDNAATSPEYQRARNSMRTIIATYLYSTSGATANPGEVENQINVLMPGPNEAPESVADKKARLKTMVDAIRQAGGNWTPPPSEETSPPASGGADGWRQVAPGIKLRKVN